MGKWIGRLRVATVGLGGLTAIVLGTVAASATSLGVNPGTTWSIQPTPNRSNDFNQLSGVSANTASDVWAVGRFRGPSSFAFKTLIEHFDGATWRALRSPNSGNLNNELNAVSADSTTEAWAVGFHVVGSVDRTLTEHWNGARWSVLASPNVGSDRNDLRGVAAKSPTDAWAVGAVGVTNATLAEHWNGTSWSVVPSPNPLPTTKGNNFLTGVTAVSADDVWAVGSTLDFTLGGLEQTMTLHWDGAAWIVVASPNQGAGSNLLLGVDSPGGGVVFAAGSFQGSGGTSRTLVLRTTDG